MLLTCDPGIADARVLGQSQHHGVVLLRMPNEMANDRINELVGGLLAQVPIEEMENLLVVMQPGTVRLRRTDS